MSMLIARPGDTVAEMFAHRGRVDVPTGRKIRWHDVVIRMLSALFFFAFGMVGLAADPVQLPTFIAVIPFVGAAFMLVTIVKDGSFDIRWRRRRDIAQTNNTRLDELIAVGRIFDVSPALLEIFNIEIDRLGITDISGQYVQSIIEDHYDQFVNLGNPTQTNNYNDVVRTYEAVTDALWPAGLQQDAARNSRIRIARQQKTEWLAAQAERLYDASQ